MQPDTFLKQLKQKRELKIFEFTFRLMKNKNTTVWNNKKNEIELYLSPEEAYHVYRNIIHSYKNKSNHIIKIIVNGMTDFLNIGKFIYLKYSIFQKIGNIK